MFTCGSCYREFPAGEHSRQQHLDATGHCAPPFECHSCDRYFGTLQGVNQHMTVMSHWRDLCYECHHCHKFFKGEHVLHQHIVRDHLYCDPCDRRFQNWNNMNAHLHSKIHRDSSVRCIFCLDEHGTATGVVRHLESGCCPAAPLDRDELYRAVRNRDPDGLIANLLLNWSGSDVYEVSELAWNSSVEAYQCYLCARLFTKISSLNQHLNSPVHQRELYHCPHRQCIKEFTTLAALVNHLESESCGYMRFESVQNNVGNLLDPRRMIEI